MKNSKTVNGWSDHPLKKTFLIMRIIVFLLLVTIFQTYANDAYSQRTKLSLAFNNTELELVLDAIENQSEFFFLYNEKLVDVHRKVSVKANDQAITEILNGLFEGTDVEYSILDRKIVLAPENINEAVQQQRSVSGKVTDRVGLPLPGVTVVIQGTTQGTITDSNGNYVLNNISDNSTLVFSFVGMRSQETFVGNLAIINVTLVEETIGIEEVVAIGYGTMKKSDVTGAVSSVVTESIENEKPQNIQDILRGNIPGLEVGFNTRAKGEGGLEIRGVNTLLTSSAPLLVIDGVIYPGELSDINPYDIERIDVLKDASSAAVFGARAANGVILITTTKGNKGKPIINFNTSVGIATMAKIPEVYGPYEFLEWRTDVMKSLNLYNPSLKDKLYVFDNPDNLPQGVTVDMWKDANSSDDLTTIWLNRLALFPSAIERYKKGQYNNWGDIVFQNGIRQDHNVSLSGQNNEVAYYWSLGYQDNEGIIVDDEFKTIRTRLNLSSNVTQWLEVGIYTQFANRDESSIPATWQAIELVDPWKPDKNPDGTLFIGDDLPVGVRHPLYNKSFQTREDITSSLISTMFANIKLPFNFSYKLNFSPRFEWNSYMNHNSALHQEWKVYGGEARRDQSKIYSWQIDNLLKWKKTFNSKHEFDLTLLQNAEKYQSWYNRMDAQNFSPTDALGFHNMQSGASSSYSMRSDDAYSTGDALMARLFYSFQNKYMTTLSIRRDGYSAFGMGNPYGTFPSAALGWVFTEDGLLTSIFNYGKLRISWGDNGNREIGRYDALSNMGTGKYPYESLSGRVSEVNRLYVNRMANYNLKWEKTRSLNFGLDFSISQNNNITGSIEYYRSSTLDLLINRALPNVTGFASVNTNLGEVANNGIEVMLNALIIDKDNFSWNSNLTFSSNRNKIKKLYGDSVDILDESGNVIGQKEADDITNEWFIGQAIDRIWEHKVLGVWQLGEEDEAAKYGNFPGDFKLQDVNNDGAIDISDKVFQGYMEPRFRWNWRNRFNFYENFEMSFNIYSYWGHYDIYNVAKNNGGIDQENYPDRNNSYKYPYWTPENPINDYARNFSGDGGVLYDVYREKSFIRLDNVSFAYSLPRAILNTMNIGNVKFTGSIRNCAVWAPHWDFWDPEFSGPNPRYFTFSIDLTI